MCKSCYLCRSKWSPLLTLCSGICCVGLLVFLFSPYNYLNSPKYRKRTRTSVCECYKLLHKARLADKEWGSLIAIGVSLGSRVLQTIEVLKTILDYFLLTLPSVIHKYECVYFHISNWSYEKFIIAERRTWYCQLGRTCKIRSFESHYYLNLYKGSLTRLL